jgi:tetratricopeptide (TPR) repeat protein
MLLAAFLLGAGLFVTGVLGEGRSFRTGGSVIFAVSILAVSLVQIIPLPGSLRRAIDPAGSSLLDGNPFIGGPFPLSLDPPMTRAVVGRAAMALVIFVAAFHMASGHRHRFWLVRGVGIAGIAAVAIGIAHRLLSIPKLFGVLISTHRTLLIGPFVNANHTAELLELAAFACLACSFLRPTMFNRIGWLVGTFLCAGGVAATLSRGGVAALAGAVILFVFLRYNAKEDTGPHRRRAALAWGALLVGLVVLGAGALGASQLIDRFQASSVTSDVRFRVWRDALRVLAAHPFGIGRGAFDRIYPVYRTIKTPFPMRFAFLENEPLQLLIDCGWASFLAIALSAAAVVWQIARRGRRDKIEAALVAALFAVVIHNFVDFGLETAGVVLPFMAILGTTIGRAANPPLLLTARRGLALGLLTLIGLAVGLTGIAHASYDDFDGALKRTMSSDQRRAILIRAQQAHPVDYFYALALSKLEPLAAADHASPRMHALNRALTLCPSCEAVHVEVARNLWKLGLRQQSLLEWRTAIELQPKVFSTATAELFKLGATPGELAAIASSSPALMVEVANILDRTGRPSDAAVVLGQAEALGAPTPDVLIARGQVQLDSQQLTAASATVATARSAGIRDPRLAILEARLKLASADKDAADQAFQVLDAAAKQYPGDVSIQRMRLDVAVTSGKWAALTGMLEGYKQALYAHDGSATEAHITAGRILARMGRATEALGEYRIALADQPANVPLWLEYGAAAASAGRIGTAREAYSEAARLNPHQPDIEQAIHGLDERRRATLGEFGLREGQR